jgi:hypothetical protein
MTSVRVYFPWPNKTLDNSQDVTSWENYRVPLIEYYVSANAILPRKTLTGKTLMTYTWYENYVTQLCDHVHRLKEGFFAGVQPNQTRRFQSTINTYFFCVFIGWQQGCCLPCSTLRISKCMSLTYYSLFLNHPSPANNGSAVPEAVRVNT